MFSWAEGERRGGRMRVWIGGLVVDGGEEEGVGEELLLLLLVAEVAGGDEVDGEVGLAVEERVGLEDVS